MRHKVFHDKNIKRSKCIRTLKRHRNCEREYNMTVIKLVKLGGMSKIMENKNLKNKRIKIDEI